MAMRESEKRAVKKYQSGFDRQTVSLQKGIKDHIKQSYGITMQRFVTMAILEKLERDNKKY